MTTSETKSKEELEILSDLNQFDWDEVKQCSFCADWFFVGYHFATEKWLVAQCDYLLNNWYVVQLFDNQTDAVELFEGELDEHERLED